MADTILKICDCEHEYQDQKYGKQRRLHNCCTKDKTKCRCTVCSKIKVK